MANRSLKRLINDIDFSMRVLRKRGLYLNDVLKRYQSQRPMSEKPDRNVLKDMKETPHGGLNPEVVEAARHSHISKYSSSDEEDRISNNKWKPEFAWLSKAFEPALQLYKWAVPAGNGIGDRIPPINKSLSEIFASIQRSKAGLQDWSFSDLTLGLYLMYLQQPSKKEDVKGELVFSETIVQDLIYHTELAKGAYKDSATALARYSMLRESNVVKFVKNSSILRPGYYIGIDMRKKLVILGIRGTHNVYDLITDIVSLSNDEVVTFEGYSTHFGVAEAAHWFLTHEMNTLRRCLHEHKGFRLRLVGHSLGAATASLLAIMLRKKSSEELGFNPEIVSAVGYATPPCVSKELAESCCDFVSTVIMEDDIIPRLSVASLTRLRNEILLTDWAKVLEKEDWKGLVDLVTNAKQVASSMQDVARKFADYANTRGRAKFPDSPSVREDVPVATAKHVTSSSSVTNSVVPTNEKAASLASSVAKELFVPGSVYYLKRYVETLDNEKSGEYFTLWKRHPGEHFQRIVLSSNLILHHKCDSHKYALRDVLKGLPPSTDDEAIFR
ncbi:hypothetical protein Leryth_003948 [Lithospermum erythrorhizon]|nr:hypothetical protein Leryth_003948 [Lithospermum erythrorhizon]